MARGRPPIITDERILEVAREVFLERGIRATTAEVAERAGISEATVFHRFKTKDALFRRAMQHEEEPTTLPPFLEKLEQLAGTGDPAEHLSYLLRTFLEIMRIRLPMMIMAWSNPDAMLRRLRDNKSMKARAHQAVLRYLEAELRLGRLRPAQPEVLATVLYGSLHGYVMQDLLDPKSVLPPETFVREFVRLLVNADADAQPASGEVAIRPRRRAAPDAHPRVKAEKPTRKATKKATKKAASGGRRSR